jgi:DNA replication protein DnaC
MCEGTLCGGIGVGKTLVYMYILVAAQHVGRLSLYISPVMYFSQLIMACRDGRKGGQDLGRGVVVDHRRSFDQGVLTGS